MRIHTALAVATVGLLAGTGAVLATTGDDDMADGAHRDESAAEHAAPAGGDQPPHRSLNPTSTTSTTDAGSTEQAAPEPAPPYDPAEPDDDAHEVLSGGGEDPEPEGPTDPIGEVDPGDYVPEGLDITAFPGAADVYEPPAPDYEPAVDGPNAISPGPGCAYQCIVSGIAYPRGIGAELVVKTKVPASLWMSVIADPDGDGDWDFSEYHTSPGMSTEYSWPLDDLWPGQKYYAMVVATDEHDDRSYAWGEFTTLSTRTVEIAIDSVEITGGPTNVNGTYHRLRFEGGEFQSYDLGARWTFEDVDPTVDVELGVFRSWPGKICEGLWDSLLDSVYGDSDDSCASWNTARAFSIDVDGAKPAKNRWTSNSFTAVARSPQVGADAPRWFDVAAYISVHVSYS